MKKLITFSAVTLLGMGVFAGCKKSSSAPTYSMTATVGSAAFSAVNCWSVNNGVAVMIEGMAGTQSAPTYPLLVITLKGYNKTTGTITLDSDTAASGNFAQYVNGMADITYSKSGSIKITSVSPNITGTFSFTCSDGTVVSGGSFTAKSY